MKCKMEILVIGHCHVTGCLFVCLFVCVLVWESDERMLRKITITKYYGDGGVEGRKLYYK